MCGVNGVMGSLYQALPSVPVSMGEISQKVKSVASGVFVLANLLLGFYFNQKIFFVGVAFGALAISPDLLKNLADKVSPLFEKALGTSLVLTALTVFATFPIPIIAHSFLTGVYIGEKYREFAT